jgi:hypothetical protein
MALIPLYFPVVDSFDIDPDTLDIKQGMLVALNGNAGVRRVTTGDDAKVLGLAGDTKSDTASSMPGISSGWQNRASDRFDETRASGKLTVYHSGGTFATDQFVDTTMDTAGVYLIADESTGTLKYGGTDPHTLLNAGTPPVAMLLVAAGAYPSGVPGTDVNNDAELGGDNSNQYITVKLLV